MIKKKKYIFRRFIAGIIDYTYIFITTAYIAKNFGEVTEDGAYSLKGVSAFLPMLPWLLVTVISEQVYQGSVGNLIVGLRVYDIKGAESISIVRSFLRHLFDLLDLLGIGLILIMSSDNSQRIGDIVANTYVDKNNQE